MAKPFVNPFVSGQFLELRVDALVSDGRGLGRHDGVVVLVEDALPGQLVRARVAAVRKSLAEAALVEVLERSPDEQEPPCPHAGRCGGCSWQSLAYGRQLAWKERIVHDALERVGKVACWSSGSRFSVIPGSRLRPHATEPELTIITSNLFLCNSEIWSTSEDICVISRLPSLRVITFVPIFTTILFMLIPLY